MSTNAQAKMFQPIQVGDMNLAHRVVMAPLTCVLYHIYIFLISNTRTYRRLRGTADHNPGPHSALYYAQRATAPGTLIISEGTLVSGKAGTFSGVTYVNTEEQIAGWKSVSE